MKVDVKGVICSNDDQWAYDMFEMDSTSPKNVSKAIKEAKGKDLEVVINSGGGDLFSGSEIFSALKEYSGKVVVKIVGIAGSSASIIAMGADTIKMSPTATLMIHNPSMVNQGDNEGMKHASTILETLNKTVAGAYQSKTGMSQKELLDLMKKESWFDATAAKEKGFIDEIMFKEQIKAVASTSGTLPQNVIDTLRSKKFTAEASENEEEEEQEEQEETQDDKVEKMLKEVLNKLDVIIDNTKGEEPEDDEGESINDPLEPTNNNWLF